MATTPTTAAGSVSTELPLNSKYPSSNSPYAKKELPDLEYTLHTRKWYIALFWSLVLFDSVAIPLALYFGLFFGTHLSHNAGETRRIIWKLPLFTWRTLSFQYLYRRTGRGLY